MNVSIFNKTKFMFHKTPNTSCDDPMSLKTGSKFDAKMHAEYRI